MKLFIKVVVVLCQWQIIFGHPGIVDSPDTRGRNREKSSTKLSTNKNEIIPSYEVIKSTTSTPSTTTTNLQPIKLTHEDVVLGANSVYGSHFQSSSSPQQLSSGGGIIFAVDNGQGSNSIMSSAQPVLLQYLSPDGIPHKTAVQYIQLLRPLMVVQPRPVNDFSIEPKTTNNVFMPQIKSSLIGAHSIPLTSYSRPSPQTDITLNMNEYVPDASSRMSTTTFYPKSMMMNDVIQGFMPTTHYQMMAQRA